MDTNTTIGQSTLQAIGDVATSVGANLVRGYVFPGDIHTFSLRFESLKPYVKDLTGTFPEYFDVWKKKVENDEMMIGYLDYTIDKQDLRNKLPESGSK